MIQHTFTCTRCQSASIVKNGHNGSGSPQFKCRDCGRSSALVPQSRYSEERKREIIAAYYQTGSQRAIYRLYGVAPATLTSWIKAFGLEGPCLPKPPGHINPDT